MTTALKEWSAVVHALLDGRQTVLLRKGGIHEKRFAVAEAFEIAVAEVAATTRRLLSELPARRQPPKTIPPLRRPEVIARLASK